MASTRADVFNFLRDEYGDALAVEMEGRGFLQATHANQPVSALIVRGVSDLLDRKQQSDTQGFQRFAAAAASAFAFEVLANLETPSSGESGQYVIVLSATIDEIDRARAEAIVAHLQKIANDARLTLSRIEKGSVRLVLEGSRDGFERIRSAFQSGTLAEEVGFQVVDVEWEATLPEPSNERRELEAVIEEQLPAAKAGSREAINRIFEAAYPQANVIAQHTVRRIMYPSRWYDAEDVVLDAFVRAYERISSFKGTTAAEFLRWFTMIVTFEARAMFLRQMARQRTQPAVDNYLGADEAGSDWVDAVERLEAMQSVERALHELPERERMILRLRFFEDRTYCEIAELMGLSQNAVRAIAHRATLRLRDQLRRSEVEDT